MRSALPGVGHQDVRGLEVSMNDVLFMRVLNGFEDLQVGQPFCIYPCIVETRDMRVL